MATTTKSKKTAKHSAPTVAEKAFFERVNGLIKNAIEASGKRKSEVAKIAGLSPARLSVILRGGNMTLVTLRRVVAPLGLEPDLALSSAVAAKKSGRPAKKSKK